MVVWLAALLMECHDERCQQAPCEPDSEGSFNDQLDLPTFYAREPGGVQVPLALFFLRLVFSVECLVDVSWLALHGALRLPPRSVSSL